MNRELFYRITGFLDGICSSANFFGGQDTWFFDFFEYTSINDIEECARNFMINGGYPAVKSSEFLKLEQVSNWHNSVCRSCNDWFFVGFRVYNSIIEYKYKSQEYLQLPIEKRKMVNCITVEFMKLLKDFFKGTDVKVYKLKTKPQWADEFSWQQFFFYYQDKVYVLSFYQQG